VAGQSRDADADIITAGGERPAGRARRARAVWLLAIAQSAGLIALISVAVHYRAEAGRVTHGGPPASQQSPSALPETVADVYWLALSPSAVYASPGLHGRFAQGSAAPFPAGRAPCAPS
jgi:hypothetical protein